MEEIVRKVSEHIKIKLLNDFSGHDWYHVERVYNNSVLIASHISDCDMLLVELSALLHDIADHKFGYSELERNQEISTLLLDLNVDELITRKVINIVNKVSYSKNKNCTTEEIETKVIQDADRLDAIGAIGIARTFAFGGNMQVPIITQNESDTTSIKHFYDKLLLLKDTMHTDIGKKLALERHLFMIEFLKQFQKETQHAHFKSTVVNLSPAYEH